MKRCCLLLIALALFTGACDQQEPVLTAHEPQRTGLAPSGLAPSSATTDDPFARLAAFVDGVNARLQANGSPLRLEYPWLFVVGPGTDPFGRLRTGARWVNPGDVTYLLDESDYTTDIPAADVEGTLVHAYDSWNIIENTALQATRLPDNGDNNDILDGMLIEVEKEEGGKETVCKDIFDPTSPNFAYVLDPVTGGVIPTAIKTNSEADIIVGGWLDPVYFEQCLGSSSILGVTWSFSFGDRDSDNYVDRVYVEQFYNSAFEWVISGSQYLDFGGPIDLETIAVHENGHAHGLGHFGGPIVDQQWKLKGQDRVFSPEAVMNPYYLGGEKRQPLPTDVAGIQTLYSDGS